MNRIDEKFAQLRAENKKALIAFLTAGYPDFAATEELILEFEAGGVDLIELGVPFSDPIADGPVIQRSSHEALLGGATLKKILALAAGVRRRSRIPLAAMSYFNPILRYGPERFVRDALRVGLDAVIVPDLPPEEEKAFSDAARRGGLDIIVFVAPTTPRARARAIAARGQGFIYFVSLTGVTGARRQLPAALKGQLAVLKKVAGRVPVCAGFGVSSPAQARAVAALCDGVIIGSAIVERITENLKRPDMVRRVGAFVRRLRTGIDA